VAKYLSSFLKFEVKKKRKNAEEAKPYHFAVCYYCVIFVTTRGYRDGVPSRWRPTGFRGRAPGRCSNFTDFFLKKYAF